MTTSTCFRNTIASIVIATVTLAVPSAGARDDTTTADGSAFTIGQWHEVESKVLGETRRVIVSSPDGYEGGEQRYAVLYLLDGDYHFAHTVGLVDILVKNDLMPPTLVVAVTNTDRARDMTPPSREPMPMVGEGGGAANFMRFFGEELIPHIDSTFRTHDYRILVGHSFGGLFAVHALVHDPDLFDAYIAISPSLQWDEQMLVSQADAFFRDTDALAKTLYMTTGNEGMGLTGGVLKLAGVLTEHTPEGFEWDSRIMSEETHNSVVHRSTRQGLEFVFRHWGLRDVVALYDSGGFEAIHAHFAAATERYGIERATPPMTMLGLSAQLAMSGRIDDAHHVLEHDPETFPPNAMIYLMLAKEHEERDDADAVIRCYTRALEINPASEEARTALTDLGVDVSSLVTTFAVPVETLRTYTGTYAAPGAPGAVTVELVDDALQLSGPMGIRDLTPIALDRFVTADQPVEFVFVADDTGQVTTLSIEISGQAVMTAQRTD